MKFPWSFTMGIFERISIQTLILFISKICSEKWHESSTRRTNDKRYSIIKTKTQFRRCCCRICDFECYSCVFSTIEQQIFDQIVQIPSAQMARWRKLWAISNSLNSKQFWGRKESFLWWSPIETASWIEMSINRNISTSYHFTCTPYHLQVVMFDRFTAPEVSKLLKMGFQLKHIIRL